MNLVDLPEAPQKPRVEILAEKMLHDLNATLAERVHDHRVFYRAFWDAPETPDDLLIAMGAHAPVLLAAAGENLQHIGRLAGIVGKTLHDFLPPEDYEPRRAFIVDEFGTVTLEPPGEGFDAWVRAIPEPPVEPQPEPEVTE